MDLDVGFDLFRAQMITESVRAAGHDVRLREMTMEGMAFTPSHARQFFGSSRNGVDLSGPGSLGSPRTRSPMMFR